MHSSTHKQTHMIIWIVQLIVKPLYSFAPIDPITSILYGFTASKLHICCKLYCIAVCASAWMSYMYKQWVFIGVVSVCDFERPYLSSIEWALRIHIFFIVQFYHFTGALWLQIFSEYRHFDDYGYSDPNITWSWDMESEVVSMDVASFMVWRYTPS